LGEVAIQAYGGARLGDRRVERAAQKARVHQDARKLGIEIALDEADRVVDRAYDEPQISVIAFGQGVAADCLKHHGIPAAPERADVCFEVARYTREFFLDKRFIPLDRKLQAIDKLVADPLERELTRELAQEVYRSKVPAEGTHEFGAGFYERCLAPAGSRP
jgi:hypothetical protein